MVQIVFKRVDHRTWLREVASGIDAARTWMRGVLQQFGFLPFPGFEMSLHAIDDQVSEHGQPELMALCWQHGQQVINILHRHVPEALAGIDVVLRLRENGVLFDASVQMSKHSRNERVQRATQMIQQGNDLATVASIPLAAVRTEAAALLDFAEKSLHSSGNPATRHANGSGD